MDNSFQLSFQHSVKNSVHNKLSQTDCKIQGLYTVCIVLLFCLVHIMNFQHLHHRWKILRLKIK